MHLIWVNHEKLVMVKLICFFEMTFISCSRLKISCFLYHWIHRPKPQCSKQMVAMKICAHSCKNYHFDPTHFVIDTSHHGVLTDHFFFSEVSEGMSQCEFFWKRRTVESWNQSVRRIYIKCYGCSFGPNQYFEFYVQHCSVRLYCTKRNVLTPDFKYRMASPTRKLSGQKACEPIKVSRDTITAGWLPGDSKWNLWQDCSTCPCL